MEDRRQVAGTRLRLGRVAGEPALSTALHRRRDRYTLLLKVPTGARTNRRDLFTALVRAELTELVPLSRAIVRVLEGQPAGYSVACPACSAPASSTCTSRTGKPVSSHVARLDLARRDVTTSVLRARPKLKRPADS